MTKETAAVYWDFENIHASLFDAKKGSGSYGKTSNRNRQQDVMLDVSALYEYAASFGNIAINKAYANWQWFAKYRQVLLKCAIELIQIFPPGASAKNGADIKLSLDAVEDILKFPHISSIIVILDRSEHDRLRRGSIRVQGTVDHELRCVCTRLHHYAG